MQVQNNPSYLTKWINIILKNYPDSLFNKPGNMCQMKRIGSTLVTIVILTMFGCGLAVIEDSDRELVAANFPYGRGVDSDQLQLARILLFPQRMCHAKRNSELINSLLSLPKNMNNVGK